MIRFRPILTARSALPDSAAPSPGASPAVRAGSSPSPSNGHLRTSISGGYASRDRDGIHDLLDIETARATADTLTDLNDALAAGVGVSGPAPRRAIHAAANAPSFDGAILTARQARDLLGNPALARKPTNSSLRPRSWKAGCRAHPRTPR
jgi:hypothetical protein